MVEGKLPTEPARHSSAGRGGGSCAMPTALDNGRRSPHKLLRAVVARGSGEAIRERGRNRRPPPFLPAL